MATLETEESGRCKKVGTRVNVWIFCPPGGKKGVRCREVAVSGGSSVQSTNPFLRTPTQ